MANVCRQDHQVSIQASTTIHSIVNAAVEIAETLSVDRLSLFYAEKFEQAAKIIRERLGQRSNQ
jgi:hypothetical protein